MGIKITQIYEELVYALFCRFPLLGEFTSQNAIIAERFIEAGSAYVSNSSFFYYGLKKESGIKKYSMSVTSYTYLSSFFSKLFYLTRDVFFMAAMS